MALHRFFLENQVLSAEDDAVFAVRLSEADLRHARVLRLTPGEHIAIIDASTDYFECEVVDFTNDLMVRITRHRHAREEGARVILLQGLGKADKFDEVVRHATEIGVSAFIPLLSKRTVVKLDDKKVQSRMQRWESIAKSAAMQAGLDAIPEIASPVSVDEAASMISGATCVLVCWEEAHTFTIKQAIDIALSETLTPAVDARIAIVVGPEGGLTDDEVTLLTSSHPHAYAVTLGPNILRTETAGLIAPALAIYELGGLQ